MILLDTHVLIWLTTDPSKLSIKASAAIHEARRSGGLAISAITLWELAWLATRGRIEFTGPQEASVEEMTSRVSIRPITTKIAFLANQLPESYRRDAGDRLIGATAIHEGIALVTMDRSIRDHKQVKTIW